MKRIRFSRLATSRIINPKVSRMFNHGKYTPNFNRMLSYQLNPCYHPKLDELGISCPGIGHINPKPKDYGEYTDTHRKLEDDMIRSLSLSISNFLKNKHRTVKICEVGPRDGLQSEKKVLSVEDRVEFINRLSETGIPYIEIGSFVPKNRIPQLYDTCSVYSQIGKYDLTEYSALAPNLVGVTQAIECGIKTIAIVTSPSDSFCKENTNCTSEESLQKCKEICNEVDIYNLETFYPYMYSEYNPAPMAFKYIREMIEGKNDVKVRGYISCIDRCPYQGPISTDSVVQVAEELIGMGCYEISLGDTMGYLTPERTDDLLKQVKKYIPKDKIAVHFHNTNGLALRNIEVALDNDIDIIDSSVGGIGGCPYAKGSTGNVATEDVVELLNDKNITTHIDLDGLRDVSKWIKNTLI